MRTKRGNEARVFELQKCNYKTPVNGTKAVKHRQFLFQVQKEVSMKEKVTSNLVYISFNFGAVAQEFPH